MLLPAWHAANVQPGFDGKRIKVFNVQEMNEKLLNFMQDGDLHREDLRKGMEFVHVFAWTVCILHMAYYSMF